MSGIAYAGFDRDYAAIWVDSPNYSKSTLYILYRTFFAASTFIYQFFFGIFLLQLRYFQSVVSRFPKSIVSIAVLSIYIIIFSVCIALLAYFHFLPKTWEIWQSVGQQATFYVQSSWALLVGSFEICIALISLLKLRDMAAKTPDMFVKLNATIENDEYVAV